MAFIDAWFDQVSIKQVKESRLKALEKIVEEKKRQIAAITDPQPAHGGRRGRRAKAPETLFLTDAEGKEQGEEANDEDGEEEQDDDQDEEVQSDHQRPTTQGRPVATVRRTQGQTKATAASSRSARELPAQIFAGRSAREENMRKRKREEEETVRKRQKEEKEEIRKRQKEEEEHSRKKQRAEKENFRKKQNEEKENARKRQKEQEMAANADEDALESDDLGQSESTSLNPDGGSSMEDGSSADGSGDPGAAAPARGTTEEVEAAEVAEAAEIIQALGGGGGEAVAKAADGGEERERREGKVGEGVSPNLKSATQDTMAKARDSRQIVDAATPGSAEARSQLTSQSKGKEKLSSAYEEARAQTELPTPKSSFPPIHFPPTPDPTPQKPVGPHKPVGTFSSAEQKQRTRPLRLTETYVDRTALDRTIDDILSIYSLKSLPADKKFQVYMFIDTLFNPAGYWELRRTIARVVSKTGYGGRALNPNTSSRTDAPTNAHDRGGPSIPTPSCLSKFVQTWRKSLAAAQDSAAPAVHRILRLRHDMECYVHWQRLLAVWVGNEPDPGLDPDLSIPREAGGLTVMDTAALQTFLLGPDAEKSQRLQQGRYGKLRDGNLQNGNWAILRDLIAPHLGFDVQTPLIDNIKQDTNDDSHDFYNSKEAANQEAMARWKVFDNLWKNTMTRGKRAHIVCKHLGFGALALVTAKMSVLLSASLPFLNPCTLRTLRLPPSLIENHASHPTLIGVIDQLIPSPHIVAYIPPSATHIIPLPLSFNL